MLLCRLADLPLRLENRYPHTELLYAPFAGDAPDAIPLQVSEEEILAEEAAGGLPSEKTARLGYLEALALYRKFSHLLVQKGGFLFHAAFFTLAGAGIAYAAPSGTGKSTQAELMRAAYPNLFRYINGDKPLIRRREEGFYGYGTPFCGKERRGTVGSAPVRVVCFLERSDRDCLLPLRAEEAFPLLFSSVQAPLDPGELSALLPLLSSFLETLPVYRFLCTKRPEAAQCAYETFVKDGIVP